MYTGRLLLLVLPAVLAAPAEVSSSAVTSTSEPLFYAQTTFPTTTRPARATRATRGSTYTGCAGTSGSPYDRGVAFMDCWLSVAGWHQDAASYIATAMNADEASAADAYYNLVGNTDYFKEASAYYYTSGKEYLTNKVTGLVTFEVAHATYITNTRLRDAVTSIFVHGLSIQNAGGAAATATAATTATSAAGNGNTVVTSVATSVAQAASTSVSRAAAPSPAMQPGKALYAAAGLAVGVAGLAVGL